MSAPAMAIAIGYALQAPPLVLFSLAAVGQAANAMGGAGGPLAVLFIAIIAAELGKVSAGKLAGFSGRFTGSVRPVLLEHSHANGHIGGFTDNYLRVSVDAPASADNSIVDVRLGAYLPESESMEASVVAR